jgi:RNA polymerase sigma factor (sigma-70 family)
MADITDPGDFREDPLEKLLDEESDEDFALPEFKEHFADSLTPAVLKEWTARDFASIYVRFRPHLERHARRYLHNPSQVEEVVQDAFLYLMTSLPELDSEIGVLKFLKWKTRLLALDVIRANSRTTLAPIDDHPEFASKDPEVGSDVERAEDAAIVSLALAKLQPRHREALIATLYEEKAQEAVAAQMGLSENAFRQLLFRARSAFKKALIGEAETAGLSMSQILSIAARKAAAESGKYVSAAGAFLLVIAISIGILPNLNPAITEDQISLPQPTVSSPANPQVEPEATAEPELVVEDPIVETAPTQEIRTAAAINQPSIETVVATEPVVQTAPASASSAIDERQLLISAVTPLLGSKTLSQLGASEQSQIVSSSPQELVIQNGPKFKANIVYDLNTENGIQSGWFQFKIGGALFYAVPKTWMAQKVVESNGQIRLLFAATDLVLGNADGKLGDVVIEKSILGYGKIRLEVILDAQGNAVSSNMSIRDK